MDSVEERDSSSSNKPESDDYDELKAEAATRAAAAVTGQPPEEESDRNDANNNFESNSTTGSTTRYVIDDNNDTNRVIDFQPPANSLSMRLSPTMQKVVVSRNSPPSSPSFVFDTNETTSASPFGATMGSPFYTASSRRGQSSRQRDCIVSPRSHQAAERAARDATNKNHHSHSDPTHLRRQQIPPTV
jgi:hypothetical protein